MGGGSKKKGGREERKKGRRTEKRSGRSIKTLTTSTTALPCYSALVLCFLFLLSFFSSSSSRVWPHSLVAFFLLSQVYCRAPPDVEKKKKTVTCTSTRRRRRIRSAARLSLLGSASPNLTCFSLSAGVYIQMDTYARYTARIRIRVSPPHIERDISSRACVSKRDLSGLDLCLFTQKRRGHRAGR